MKNIDKDFYDLVKLLKSLSEEEIFENIKNYYLSLAEDVRKPLEDFLNRFGYWGTLSYENNDYTEIKNKAESLAYHLDDYIWLYEKLGDYRSKKLLLAILRNWYYYDFYNLENSREINFTPYFDLDLVECHDEVLVDLGAYTGDTVLDYLKIYGPNSYQKIYCYEITPNTFAILKNNLYQYNNIEYRRKAASDTKEIMYINNSCDASANTVSPIGSETVEAVTLDDDITESITTLKMDIEGYEQKAIRGAQKHIINDHPKLLISVYHNNEDLWKIPRMIADFDPSYKFYLRNNGGGVFPTEITLIGL